MPALATRDQFHNMSGGNKAVVVYGRGKDFRWAVEDRPIPTAVDGSVVLQILHAPTVQYSKFQFSDKGYPVPFPLTPGANGVGRVHAVGPDGTTLKKGDLVLVNSVIIPRDSSDDRLLLAFMTDGSAAAMQIMEGAWRLGTYQQYMRLPLENAVKLDEHRLCRELEYPISALSLIQTCAIGYGGLADANVKAGDTVIVAPATGRFSGASVLVALALGANVIAAGRRKEPLDELTTAMGATGSLKTVLLTGDVAKDTAAFKNAAGPRGTDVYIDWSPPAMAGTTPAYLTAGIGALRRKGTVVIMGGIAANVGIPYVQVMIRCLQIQGRFMYEPEHLQRVIKLAESGKLALGSRCGMNIAASFPLEQFEQALDKAAEYPGWGNVVELVPTQ